VTIRADILLKPYWALEAWLSFLSRVAEMLLLKKEQKATGHLKIQICHSGSDIKINLLCLDAKVGF
jgi:hypothetical protein